MVLSGTGCLRRSGEWVGRCRRWCGITVTGTPQRGALLRHINELVDYARNNGYRREELIAMINDAPWPRARNG
jgi:hypothetical protein